MKLNPLGAKTLSLSFVLACVACGHDTSPLAQDSGGAPTTGTPSASAGTGTAMGGGNGTSGSSPGAGAGTGGSTPATPATDDEALFQEALALFNAKDYAAAGPKFQQLWDQFPDSKRRDNAGYLAGRCQYELGNDAAAITTLEAMRKAYPDSHYAGSAAYFTGRARFKQGLFAEAIPDFAAGALDPAGTYADNAQYYLGRSHYEAGAYAPAKTELNKLLTLFPASTYLDNAQYYIGRSDFDNGAFSASIPSFDAVLKDSASTFADDATFYKARANYANGALATALTGFKGLQTTFPASQYLDNSDYYELKIYVDQGNCTEANVVVGRLTASGSQYLASGQSYMQQNGC